MAVAAPPSPGRLPPLDEPLGGAPYTAVPAELLPPPGEPLGGAPALPAKPPDGAPYTGTMPPESSSLHATKAVAPTTLAPNANVAARPNRLRGSAGDGR